MSNTTASLNTGSEPQKLLTYRRLRFHAMPEIWIFHLLSGFVLALLAAALTKLISFVVDSSGTAVTTANFRSFLLSWRAPVVLLLGTVLVLLFIIVEIFAQIYLMDDILAGNKSGIRREIGRGMHAIKRFLNPAGLPTLLFIFIAVPLCGVGFSISLTKSFYIPSFIMEVVEANAFYLGAYITVILLMIIIGIRSAFTIHAVLLDEMKPREARRHSAALVGANKGKLFLSLLKMFFAFLFVLLIVFFLFTVLPYVGLQQLGESLPANHVVDILQVSEDAPLTETDFLVIGYRMLCALVLLISTYLTSMTFLMSGAFFILRLTEIYLSLTRSGEDGVFIPKDREKRWPERPQKHLYLGSIVLILLSFLLSAFLAAGIGLMFDPLFSRFEPAGIIAHRTGGVLAPENSLEGIEISANLDCYGAETDIQRTKDGYYIINHDDDFKRLTGVAKRPGDMTLGEIRQLRIRDASGKETLVPTIEEMLDASRGKIKLFIELKGVSADRQMVDDVVALVREKDCVEDVALISLNYDVIDYAETNYPEFETGTLFFGGIGDISKLNCDLLIMEEETATSARIDQAHAAGKQAIVWTVNTQESMEHFLDSRIDAVITDQTKLAIEVQESLDARTDLEILLRKLNNFWD